MIYLHRWSHILYVNILAKRQGQCVNTTGGGLEADSFWSNFIQSSLQLLGTFLCMFIGIYWKIKFLSESRKAWIMNINYETRSRVLFVFFLYSRLCQPYIFLLLAAISVSMKKNLKSLSLIRYFNFPEGDWCREVHVTQFHPMRCERSLPGVFVGMISLQMKIGLLNNCLCFFR